MSYHRGDHSGAVAVSFSASTLSPSRRFSASTSSGTSVTSGTNGTANSKYSNYRTSTPSNLVNDRNTGYYSSSSNTGYRGSGYTSSASSDAFRRAYYSPARSVSSYNESCSIVGSSTLNGSSGLRYGSVSSSSASSSAGSSNSSLTSRERNNTLSHHTAGSLATTAADLYAIYSPTNYVPNIHGTGSKSSSNTSHWNSSSRPSPSSSSSGFSSSLFSSSNIGDEHQQHEDTSRERRERSYSSESTSGINNSLTSTSSNNQNAHSPSNERWTTTRREINKRRAAGAATTPSTLSSNGTSGCVGRRSPIAGNANKTEPGTSTNEVNPENIIENTDKRKNFNDEKIEKDLSFVVETNSPENHKNDEILPQEVENDDDTSRYDLTRRENRDGNLVNGRKDVNFEKNNNNNNNKDDDEAVITCKRLVDTKKSNCQIDTSVTNDTTLETRRRRKRLTNVESVIKKDLTLKNERKNLRQDDIDAVDGNDDEKKNLTTLERCFVARDKTSEREINDRGTIAGNSDIDKRENLRNDNNHHQQRNKRQNEKISKNNVNKRNNDVNIPALSSNTDNTLNNDTTTSHVDKKSFSTSNGTSSLLNTEKSSNNVVSSVETSTERIDETVKKVNSNTALTSCPRLRNIEDNGKIGNLKISVDSCVDCDVNKVSGGGAGSVVVAGAAVDSSADTINHRKALTRNKIITKNDNTELLLTNKNIHDHEDNNDLGIVEKTRKNVNDSRHVMNNDTSQGTRIHDRSGNVKVTRKTLLWTATNEIDDDEKVLSNDDKVLTNGVEINKDDRTNGYDKSGDEDETTNLRINDDERDEDVEGTSTSLMRNGVRSTGNRSDDMEKSSASRRTLFGWNDPTIDDLTGASSSSSTPASSSSSGAGASSSNSTNNAPVAVHQNIYRGSNEQIDESSNSRPPRSRLQSRRDERYGLNGLRNIGNTCFMNSVIQCLSNTRPLLEYLLNEQHLHDINTTTSGMKGALIKAFGQVIQELWEMSGDHVINTTALKSQIQRFAPRFMGYSQQDAQEFLRYLLEGLHEDVNRVTVKPQPILTDIPDHYSDSHKASESWKRYLRSEDSTIVDVFVGQLRSSLHCTACDHVSVTLDPFWDLSLPIPMRLGTVKLNQCLEHFTKVETLDGDEKPTCSKCQMRRKCTKSFSIQKFPKILVIHLKRFSPTERFRGKLSVLVDFPLTCLDLSAFAAPGVQGCTYNLYGVANHSGTTYSGHYTAYCKHPYSGEWHEYNDSRVSTVSSRSVVSSEAYVLFYEQQQTSPHL